jgi:hypothetical protein
VVAGARRPPVTLEPRQRLFHTGYEAREVDVRDLELLAGLDP